MDSSNSVIKYRIFRTLAIYASFFGLGVCSGLFGPALLDFEIMLKTTTKMVALGISSHAFGYLAGSFLCSILYDRLSPEFWFFIANLGETLSIIAVPLSPNLGLFIFFNILSGLFMGTIDSGGQSYVVHIWKGSKFLEPLLQTVHAVWSLGATIGPLIAKPFLLEKLPTTHEKNDPDLVYTTINPNYTAGLNNSIDPEETRVHFAGIAAGAIAVPSVVMFAILFFLLKSSILRKKNNKMEKEDIKPDEKSVQNENEKPSKRRRVILLLLLATFYFWLLVTEDTPGHFLAVFVIKGLHWENSKGPLITSTLWGAHSLGRFLAVPFSLFLRPKTMVIITVILTFLSMSVTAFFCRLHPLVMWISIAGFGLGMSSIYASLVLRASEKLEMDGTAAGIISIGSSLGNIIGPAIVGFLFDSVSPLAVPYASLLGSFMCIVSYAGFELAVKKLKNRKNSLKSDILIDKTFEESSSPNKEEPTSKLVTNL